MKRILIFSLLLALCGCRPASVMPGPGPTPDGNGGDGGGDDDAGGVVSIAYLKSLYKGAPVKVTGETVISGIVTSSDRDGNFYKTLVVEDATGGIELKADLEELFKHYKIHSRLDVRCNGLWLGSYGGTLQLGAEPFGEFQTQYIPAGDLPLHLQPAGAAGCEVLPRRLTIGGLTARDISTFACFEGVDFIEEERGFTWAEPDADTDRHLVDAAGDTLLVRTSPYARFALHTLPEGPFYIEGILGYFNGRHQLRVVESQSAVVPEAE